MNHEILADITGIVMSISANVGQDLAVGDEVMVLESMKMMVPILTTVSGTVMSIEVSEGASVEEGNPVATLRLSS